MVSYTQYEDSSCLGSDGDQYGPYESQYSTEQYSSENTETVYPIARDCIIFPLVRLDEDLQVLFSASLA